MINDWKGKPLKLVDAYHILLANAQALSSIRAAVAN